MNNNIHEINRIRCERQGNQVKGTRNSNSISAAQYHKDSLLKHNDNLRPRSADLAMTSILGSTPARDLVISRTSERCACTQCRHVGCMPCAEGRHDCTAAAPQTARLYIPITQSWGMFTSTEQGDTQSAALLVMPTPQAHACWHKHMYAPFRPKVALPRSYYVLYSLAALHVFLQSL